MPLYTWQHAQPIPSQKYRCWQCDLSIASERGWQAQDAARPGVAVAFLCICHRCSAATFVSPAGQIPGARFGNAVQHIGDEAVAKLYDEARACMADSAYTAAVLACRKLLMHVAVAKGAPLDQPFVAYVKYLADQHYIPPDAHSWVDHIRKKGNEANHEIVIMSQGEAEELIGFSEMLLKLIYEFPALARTSRLLKRSVLDR